MECSTGRPEPAAEPGKFSLRETFFRPIFIHLFIIAAVGLLSYSNSFHVPLVYDDIGYIASNPIIKDSSYILGQTDEEDLSLSENVRSSYKSEVYRLSEFLPEF